jgi:hypothetical protein
LNNKGEGKGYKNRISHSSGPNRCADDPEWKESYTGADTLTREERVESLLGETETIRLSAEVGKLDPHLLVLRGREDEASDRQHSLPDLDVLLASLEPEGEVSDGYA